MLNNVEVSVICVTYNQEKYIEKAIKSFLMQKTNFEYEIIIHDDASTDNTTSIIKEYEKKYPSKVRTIIEEKNIHSQNKSVFEHSIIDVKGKYIAMCDGDDFYSDENKLQEQYDTLEKNPNCCACVHIVSTCDEDETPCEAIRPSEKYNLEEGIIRQDELADLLFVKASSKCPFQTTSFFYRKEIAIDGISKNWCIDRRRYYDINMLKMFLCYGNIYYINKILATHRINAINSITEAAKKDNKIMPSEKLHLINEDIGFNEYTKKKYNKLIMTEIYKYLLFAKENKINENENKELIKEHSFSKLGFIKYVGLKGLLIHFLKGSYLLKKYQTVTKTK